MKAYDSIVYLLISDYFSISVEIDVIVPESYEVSESSLFDKSETRMLCYFCNCKSRLVEV